jgi:ABC-2 type transport system ATP-binding protein
LLLLDEPLAYLDPNVQSSFLDDLMDVTRWRDRPIATLISSQHLHEVEAIADKVIFMNEGAIEFHGPPGEIGSSSDSPQFEIACSLTSDELRRELETLGTIATRESAICTVVTLQPGQSSSQALGYLLSTGVAVRYFRDISSSTKRLFR